MDSTLTANMYDGRRVWSRLVDDPIGSLVVLPPAGHSGRAFLEPVTPSRVDITHGWRPYLEGLGKRLNVLSPDARRMDFDGDGTKERHWAYDGEDYPVIDRCLVEARLRLPWSVVDAREVTEDEQRIVALIEAGVVYTRDLAKHVGWEAPTLEELGTIDRQLQRLQERGVIWRPGVTLFGQSSGAGMTLVYRTYWPGKADFFVTHGAAVDGHTRGILANAAPVHTLYACGTLDGIIGSSRDAARWVYTQMGNELFRSMGLNPEEVRPTLHRKEGNHRGNPEEGKGARQNVYHRAARHGDVFTEALCFDWGFHPWPMGAQFRLQEYAHEMAVRLGVWAGSEVIGG